MVGLGFKHLSHWKSAWNEFLFFCLSGSSGKEKAEYTDETFCRSGGWTQGPKVKKILAEILSRFHQKYFQHSIKILEGFHKKNTFRSCQSSGWTLGPKVGEMLLRME